MSIPLGDFMLIEGYFGVEEVCHNHGIAYKTLLMRIKRSGIKPLRVGNTILLTQDQVEKLMKKPPVTPRESTGRKTHPDTYNSWTGMKQRCYNPRHRAYPNHGGRGIKVCDRWKNSFDYFLQDMGPKPPGLTLERINNEEDYKPTNCRWATWSDQNKNKRPWGTVSGRKSS